MFLCPVLGSGNVGDEAAEYIQQCANLLILDIQVYKIKDSFL